MDNVEEMQLRKAGFAFACALIGKFMVMHRARYGCDPKPAEITGFCLNVMYAYLGKEFSINSATAETLIRDAMEKAHKEEIISPFEKGRKNA